MDKKSCREPHKNCYCALFTRYIFRYNLYINQLPNKHYLIAYLVIITYIYQYTIKEIIQVAILLFICDSTVIIFASFLNSPFEKILLRLEENLKIPDFITID